MPRTVNKTDPLWFLPPPPKAPDYSTPEAVTARAWQGLHAWAKTCYALLKTDGKVYRDFQTALGKAGRG